jgi:hypothetical protein
MRLAVVKTTFLIVASLLLIGCATNKESSDNLPARFTIIHSTGGWGFTREWRVYENRIVVGRPRWNSSAKRDEYAVEHSQRLAVAEFRKIAGVWARLDRRLWTHSVQFTTIAILSDGPIFGLREQTGPDAAKSFGVDVPVMEMLPAVDAIGELLPQRHRPRFSATSWPYEWLVRPKS